MTDTSSGDTRGKGSYVMSPGGLGPVPPALLSGYIVILKAPIRDEIIPPDWWPRSILSLIDAEWLKALHG